MFKISNEISTFNVNHSKPNASKSNVSSKLNINYSKSNDSSRQTNNFKCLFCGKTEHYFWKCDQVKSKDERINLLKQNFPDNCIN